MLLDLLSVLTLSTVARGIPSRIRELVYCVVPGIDTNNLKRFPRAPTVIVEPAIRPVEFTLKRIAPVLRPTFHYPTDADHRELWKFGRQTGCWNSRSALRRQHPHAIISGRRPGPGGRSPA